VEAKPRLVVLSVTAASVPVPVRETACGLPGALSLTVRDAVRVPLALGWNVTVMVHVALIARVFGFTGQVLVWAKLEALVPEIAIPVMVRGAVPLFVSVTVWAGLVVLTD
jgi:hypothetical protein